MKYLILLIFLLSNIAFANIGTISSFKGSVEIQRNSLFIKPSLGLEIKENDLINTKENSNIIIKFKDNTIITLGKNSTFSIKEYIYDTKNTINSKTDFSFLKGTFKSVTGIIGKIHPEKFKLRTKTANIGIRGTTIIANQEIIACTAGQINVSSKIKTLNLSKNQYTKILDKTDTALTLNDEILNILYNGLAIDIYRKNKSEKNERLILLEDTLKKATEKTEDNGSGNSQGQGNDSAGNQGP